tara:strand:+ start:1314 stop:1778 length:465 start_codon:yes stop_codon:yes gene_type:complete
MKFKITEMTTTQMKVEYEDGTWAQIASSPKMDKTYYLTMIDRYHHTNNAEVAIKDHPMKIGDEGIVGEGIKEEDDTTTSFDYGGARIHCYPSNELQWDAAYHTRQGDNTLQEKVDAHIAMVKAEIPADDKIYSVDELDVIVQKLVKDPKWVDEN